MQACSGDTTCSVWLYAQLCLESASLQGSTEYVWRTRGWLAQLAAQGAPHWVGVAAWLHVHAFACCHRPSCNASRLASLASQLTS
jgi:hypothetical protein